MLKKAKAAMSAKSEGHAQGLSKSVLGSSHQIWLAGLGAFAKAQEGGAKFFETLVKQGEVLEAKTRKAAAQTADVARDAAMSKAKEVQAMAGGTWDKLEQVFEDRVSRALGKLGVHTSSDVERLSTRVNELSEAVNALIKSQGARHKAPPSAARKKRASGKGRRASAKTESNDAVAAARPASVTGAARKPGKVVRKHAKAAPK
jgi:poly(hydroxyalkanoate) granule-associated protein